jgi:hypothetical protein
LINDKFQNDYKSSEKKCTRKSCATAESGVKMWMFEDCLRLDTFNTPTQHFFISHHYQSDVILLILLWGCEIESTTDILKVILYIIYNIL